MLAFERFYSFSHLAFVSELEPVHPFQVVFFLDQVDLNDDEEAADIEYDSENEEMMNELKKQAQRFGTDIRNGWITKVDFSGKKHKVWINDNKILTCDTVIISTGASAKYLGIESEQKYL